MPQPLPSAVHNEALRLQILGCTIGNMRVFRADILWKKVLLHVMAVTLGMVRR